MTDSIDRDNNIVFSASLAKKIDHAVLHPTATEADFFYGCDTARAYETAAFCVPSSMIEKIARRLAGSSVKACATIGFPHGNAHSAVKIHEAVRAVEDGASEVDMVVNLGWVQLGAWKQVEAEIAAVNEAVVNRSALLKVIFETCYLSDDWIATLAKISADVGVAYIKTSTGFGTEGATVHHVSLMRKHVPDDMGIKASGGIRTLADMERFLDAGADRIGTSATAAILDAAAKRK